MAKTTRLTAVRYKFALLLLSLPGRVVAETSTDTNTDADVYIEIVPDRHTFHDVSTSANWPSLPFARLP